MSVSRDYRYGLFGAVLLVCLSITLTAQTSSAPARPVTVAVPITPQKAANKPELPVVTVVHRLNGLKMFRLLLRSQEDVQAVSQVDEAFRLMGDVHTNVIAGLALDDGFTIATWLPDAELEFGPMTLAFDESRASTPAGVAGTRANAASRNANPETYFVADPELTVIGADGQRQAARYIGLDGLTGLSILQLVNKTPSANRIANASNIAVGTNLRVLGPELAAQTKAVVAGNLFVRIGQTDGTVFGVTHSPTGDVSRFKLRSPRLNSASVGGVAVNEDGEAVGIISAIEGADATVLPAELIRKAAKRVLAQHASVPRPFLGVRGEPLAALKPEQMQGLGWETHKAMDMVEERRGILLTSILPNSPAAQAELKPGDVILKVNGEDIQNADDFSWWLDQAGASNSVNFTFVRPQSDEFKAVDVKLSGSLDPRFSFKFGQRGLANTKEFSLLKHGVETIALRPAVAARLNATAGLLVVFVAPTSAGSDAGLVAGDVIETIDGKPVDSPADFRLISDTPGRKHAVQVVRKKQKLVITLKNNENDENSPKPQK